jgi:replicative superfamily II helicase
MKKLVSSVTNKRKCGIEQSLVNVKKGVAFHHAGLSSQRRLVEQGLDHHIKCIVATDACRWCQHPARQSSS